MNLVMNQEREKALLSNQPASARAKDFLLLLCALSVAGFILAVGGQMIFDLA